MKVYGKVENALVMTKKVTPGVKDPSKQYFSVGIVKDDEIGELRCTEEVYNQVEVYNFYHFGSVYNSEYDSFNLESCRHLGMMSVPTPEKASAPEQVTAPEATPAPEKGSKK